jgi:GNAT superfamily N-acetyltransferase
MAAFFFSICKIIRVLILILGLENLVMQINYREATPNDIPALLGLIKELAEFENAPEKVETTKAQLLEDGFGLSPSYKAFVAEYEGLVIAFALSYIRYSTWKGRVLYLEDLYVQLPNRSSGIGRKLLNMKLEYAKTFGIKHLCLQVLDWNANAIKFYESYGAQLDQEWVNVLIEVKD